MRPMRTAGPAGLCLLVALTACAPAPKDTLVLSVPYEVDTLDPHARDRVSNFGIVSHFYERLVGTDSELSIVPALALNWHNPDERAWVFQLRPGARFHDGSPLGAEDVVYTFERLRDHPELEIGVYVVEIESVRARGPASVEIRTQRPAAALLNKLLSVSIVKRGSTAESLASGENGSGPYRLVEWRRGESIEVVASETGTRPAMRRATFRLGRSQAESLADLLAGTSDLAQIGSWAGAQALREREDLSVVRRTGLFVKYLGFDLQRPVTPFGPAGRNPFLARQVREAVSLAIDRTRLSEFGVPAGQILSPFLLGHDPALVPPAVDLPRARSLLAQAGFPHGFAVTLHARKLAAEAAPLVREMLDRVGIDVTVAVLSDEEFFRRAAGEGFSFFLSRYACSTGDPGDILEAGLHSLDPARHLGGNNLGRYASPELDAAIEASSALLVPRQRGERLQAIMRRLSVELPWVPLYFSEDVYALRRALSWKPRADTYVLAWEIGPGR